MHFECPADPLTVGEYERHVARSVSSTTDSASVGLAVGSIAVVSRDDTLRSSPLSLRGSPNSIAACAADEQRDAAFLRAAQLDNNGDGYALLPSARPWNNAEQDDAADDEQR